MPYNISWYIENEIIFLEYSGISTADELRESMLKITDMIERSPRHFVHVLTDAGNVTEPLKPQESVAVLREIGTHPRLGWSLLLREKSITIRIGVAIGTSIFRTRHRVFSTLEEAETFLKEMDQNLSWDRVIRQSLDSQ